MKLSILKIQRGQALVTLLFFIVIATTVTSAAVVTLLTSSTSSSHTQQSELSYYIAEAGIENALLRLIRDPNYTGETLNIGEDTVAIQVSGENPIIIISTGEAGNSVRKIQAEIVYNDNMFNVISRKEVY